MPEKKVINFGYYFFVGLGLGLTALILFFVFNSKKKCKQNTDCKQGETCNLNNGECISCPSSCSDGKNCGLDDNGCPCGNCDQGNICKDGKCNLCTPTSCVGKKCNEDNGCRSPCGCTSGLKCNQSGVCEKCTTTSCGNNNCGTDSTGCSCGDCDPGYICNTGGSTPGTCIIHCIPKCNSKCDGSPDGCDGQCNVCTQGTTCTDNKCCLDEYIYVCNEIQYAFESVKSSTGKCTSPKQYPIFGCKKADLKDNDKLLLDSMVSKGESPDTDPSIKYVNGCTEICTSSSDCLTGTTYSIDKCCLDEYIYVCGYPVSDTNPLYLGYASEKEAKSACRYNSFSKFYLYGCIKADLKTDDLLHFINAYTKDDSGKVTYVKGGTCDVNLFDYE